MCAVFFTEVGGSTLDSHHGFVVEYGMDRDVDLGELFLFSNYMVQTIAPVPQNLFGCLSYCLASKQLIFQVSMSMIQK